MTASGGAAELRSTLEMLQKKSTAEDELTLSIMSLLDHGLKEETLAGMVDVQTGHRQEEVRIFRDYVLHATYQRKLRSSRWKQEAAEQQQQMEEERADCGG